MLVLQKLTRLQRNIFSNYIKIWPTKDSFRKETTKYKLFSRYKVVHKTPFVRPTTRYLFNSRPRSLDYFKAPTP